MKFNMYSNLSSGLKRQSWSYEVLYAIMRVNEFKMIFGNETFSPHHNAIVTMESQGVFYVFLTI